MGIISLGARNRNQNIVYDHRIIKMLRHARLPNLVSLFLKFKKTVREKGNSNVRTGWFF